MKVDVDYLLVLNAIDKLENEEHLSRKESKELVTVLRAIQGDYIPTKEEMVMQYRYSEQLNSINRDENPDLFDSVFRKFVQLDCKYY